MRLLCIPTVFLYLNLSRHTNGRLLLKIVMYLHILFVLSTLIVQSYEANVVYKRYLASQLEADYNTFVIFTCTVSFGLFVAGTCCVLLKAARSSRNHLRRILNLYRVWNTTAMPIAAFLAGYAKVLAFGFHLTGFSIFTLLIVFKIFLIAQVFCIYAKLESTLFDKWKEFQVQKASEAFVYPLHKINNNDDIKDTTVWISSINPKSNDCINNPRSIINNQTEFNEDPSADDTIANETLNISNTAFKAIIISPLSITINHSKLIGEGQFGTVFKGQLRQRHQSKIPVAVKVFKNADENEMFQLLLVEIKIAIGVGEHKNVVKFHGITSNDSLKAHFSLVMEYCDGGNLEQFLNNNRHTFVNMLQEKGSIIYSDQQLYINLELHGTHTSMDLIRFANELALGMEHLTSKKIIHGDLAARNVLLTSDLTVKLTDFGMSHKLYNSSLYFSGDINKEMCLPWRWMAVEALRDFKFSEKSDVWSYGVTLWEIFSLGGFPFETTIWSLDVLKDIEKGMRLKRPAFATQEAYDVMRCCWNIDPANRPTFSTLVKLFSDPTIFSVEAAGSSMDFCPERSLTCTLIRLINKSL